MLPGVGYLSSRHDNTATFNSMSILIDEFIDKLDQTYIRMFGGEHPANTTTIRAAGIMAMEIIANTDALYHNVEHTIMVTLVGQEMVHGKYLMEGGVSHEDWVHYIVSLLCHDIGFVRGICPGDEPGKAVIDLDGNTIALPADMTDAFLTPYHVERGQLFVLWRFRDHPVVDPAVIAGNIANTKFPVPVAEDPEIVGEYPALVRSADLVGQLADPDYLRKLPALFYEFVETGANRTIGCDTADDLRQGYPDFYWTMVNRHVAKGLDYLKATREGRQWLASLHSHIFAEKHRASI